MTTAFVLRYQELCGVVSGDDVSAGTMTGTAVQTEQSDKDRTSNCHGVPRPSIDMGTTTVTNIRAEASDDDPGRIQNQIVPRCS